MKKKLFLHIGIGKTGTTALQSFLKLNNQKLHRQGFHYMRTPMWGDNSHHLLGFALWGQKQLELPNIPEVRLDDILAKMSTEINNLDDSIQNVIISSEILFELANTNKVIPLINFIHHHFEETTIVCYLRRQDEHIQSLYQQWIKTNHNVYKNLTIQQFAGEYKGDFWDTTLDSWSRYLGKENITIRLYEKSQYVGGNIFSDLSTVIGLEILDDFDYPPKEQSNLSINAEVIEILKICSDFLNFDKLRNLGVEFARPAFAKYNLLTPTERCDIVDRHAETNRKIAIEYLGRQDGILFTEPLPTLDDKYEEFSGLDINFLTATFFKILLKQHEEIAALKTQIEENKTSLKSLEESVKQSQPNNECVATSESVFELRKMHHSPFRIFNDIHEVTRNDDGSYRIQAIGNDPALIMSIPFEKNAQYIIRLELIAPTSTTTQIFYRLGSSDRYHEKNSVTQKTVQGPNDHHFYFSTPELGDSLRIDPGNVPGIYTIEDLSIKKICK